jgi:hypothetical protein
MSGWLSLGSPRITKVARAVLVLCAVQVVHGPSPPKNPPSWQGKDWKAWSANECRDVLENSPWVATVKYYETGWGTMQLRSALPVRQALTRQFLIKNGYDHSGIEKRLALDKYAARDLAEDFKDQIVAHYEYGVNRIGEEPVQFIPVNGYDGLLFTADGRTIKCLAITRLKKNLTYSRESEEFTLVFPRVVAGQPVIKPRQTKFMIAIGKSNGSTFIPGEMFDFFLYRMDYKGRVEY